MVVCPGCGFHNTNFAKTQKCEICDLELMSSTSARALASTYANKAPKPKLADLDADLNRGGWRGLDDDDDDDDDDDGGGWKLPPGRRRSSPRSSPRASRPASPRSPRGWRD